MLLGLSILLVVGVLLGTLMSVGEPEPWLIALVTIGMMAFSFIPAPLVDTCIDERIVKDFDHRPGGFFTPSSLKISFTDNQTKFYRNREPSDVGEPFCLEHNHTMQPFYEHIERIFYERNK